MGTIQVTHVGTVTQEQPTPMLRWNGAVLQQEWRVMFLEHGIAMNERREWRDVPRTAD